MVCDGRHVRLTFVERCGFVSELGFTLGRRVVGGVGDGATMNPSLMDVAENDYDDAGEDLFAIILFTMGIGVCFLLIDPFDSKSSKEELDPAKARLKGKEVVKMFGEISFVDGGRRGRL